MESASPEWLLLAPRPPFISSPSQTLRTQGGGRAAFPIWEPALAFPRRALSSFLWRRKTSGPTKEWGTATAQGSPRGPLAWVSAPGLRLPPPPSRPGFQIRKLDAPRCGSRPRPAPSPGRRSLPGVTAAARGGRAGASLAPQGRAGPRRGKGASDRQARNPRAAALAPRAGYLPSLRSYRGGARRAPGWERRKRGGPGPLGTKTKTTGSERGAPHLPPNPQPPPHTRSSFAAWMAASLSTPRLAEARDAVGRGWPPGHGGSEGTERSRERTPSCRERVGWRARSSSAPAGVCFYMFS